MSVQSRSAAPYLHCSPLATVIRRNCSQYPNQFFLKTSLSLCTDKEMSAMLSYIPEIPMKNVKHTSHWLDQFRGLGFHQISRTASLSVLSKALAVNLCSTVMDPALMCIFCFRFFFIFSFTRTCILNAKKGNKHKHSMLATLCRTCRSLCNVSCNEEVGCSSSYTKQCTMTQRTSF